MNEQPTLMRRSFAGLAAAVALFCASGASSAECAGALPVREVPVDARTLKGFGSVQKLPKAPLRDLEWVLTFDDGPFHATTPKLLDILAAHCLKAHFFLIGRRAEAAPALVRRIVEEGHGVGSHSWSHPDFGRMPPEEADEEIGRGHAALEKALARTGGRRPVLFRFPGASGFPPAPPDSYKAMAERRGLVIAGYDISAQDWRGWAPEESMKVLRATLGRGGVIVLHDAQPNTVALLPMLIEEIRRRGGSIAHLVVR